MGSPTRLVRLGFAGTLPAEASVEVYDAEPMDSDETLISVSAGEPARFSVFFLRLRLDGVMGDVSPDSAWTTLVLSAAPPEAASAFLRAGLFDWRRRNCRTFRCRRAGNVFDSLCWLRHIHRR
ncbi:hypothetical protein [Ktedonobacter racemifer]|uniref:hypothetical protein n=1 Tax=Ktedonobacter racemifer TaxID=363277 RepID=UPI00146B54C6|nr:hypothetical protein [Ktedonobacter racemifer]